MKDTLPMPVTAPLSSAQKAQIRNLIRRAARAEILPRFRTLDQGDIAIKSNANDLVTEADINAEAIITRGLQMAFPSALVVGEEAVSENPDLLNKLADAELSFLIDPVDGTWNFAKGLPLYGTIIAACRFGRPVLGMIYDPMGDDLVEADLDTPAQHLFPTGRKKPLKTAEPKARSDLMGYTSMSLQEPWERQVIANVLPEVTLISSLRCSAHEYRLLAQGAVDFVMGVRMSPWDHAAGVLICQQAGGHVAMLDGREYTAMEQGTLLCASSQAVWNDVAEMLSELIPDAGTETENRPNS